MDPITRTCLALAACTALAGRPAAQDEVPRAFTAPDGSRFLLAPDPGAPPVVHWVVTVPSSFDEDPFGALGLSRAVIRASLHGTWAHGSQDASAEAAAIAELDTLLAAAWRARNSGAAADPERDARIAAARARAAALGDPAAWRRAVERAPAVGPELREVAGASLLHVATTGAALGQVATLVRAWREDSALRGYHEIWSDMVAEVSDLAESPVGRLRREVLGTTFLGSAAARYVVGQGTFVPYGDAQRQLARLVHPLRTFHVLSGGFDPAAVEALLTEVFATTALPNPPLPAAPRPADARARRSTLPSADGVAGVALAWPLPADASAVEVDALVALLGGSSFAYLPRQLRRLGDVDLTVTAPFPPYVSPGLLLVEAITARPDGPDAADLEEVLVGRLTALATDFWPAAAEQAGRLAAGRRAIDASTPEQRAFALAVGCGLLGRAPSAVLDVTTAPDAARLHDLVIRIFGESPGTVVVLGDAR